MTTTTRSTGMTRREFAAGCGAALLRTWLGLARRAAAQAPLLSAGPADPRLIEDLVAANRILAAEGVVDGYGHVSARHDRDPSRLFVAPRVGPARVPGGGLLEFGPDSRPVDARGRASYSERFIHG